MTAIAGPKRRVSICGTARQAARYPEGTRVYRRHWRGSKPPDPEGAPSDLMTAIAGPKRRVSICGTARQAARYPEGTRVYRRHWRVTNPPDPEGAPSILPPRGVPPAQGAESAVKPGRLLHVKVPAAARDPMPRQLALAVH